MNHSYHLKTKNYFAADLMLCINVILYRYFIALRDIYQNVFPEVPGNPRDVIFPDAEGGGKYNISGIPRNGGKRSGIFPEEQ